jgi:hypothetical protein
LQINTNELRELLRPGSADSDSHSTDCNCNNEFDYDYDSDCDYGRLLDFFQRHHGPFDTIKLRRVCAHGQCIAFHSDFSKRTMHVALNPASEYDGGQLVFVSAIDGFVTPNRPQGGALIHDDSHVHGVTALARGTRYSLFLCDTVGRGPHAGYENGTAVQPGQVDLAHVDLHYLITPARDQLAFFERALRYLDQVHDDELLELTNEYAAFFARSKKGASTGTMPQHQLIGSTNNCHANTAAHTGFVMPRAPSFPVELAWRVHMLHPCIYAQDCGDTLVDHTPEHSSRYAASSPAESIESSSHGFATQHLRVGVGLDLVEGIRRQQKSMCGMLASVSRDTIGAAQVGEYRAFLAHVNGKGKSDRVPTHAVDLIWHAHQLHPRQYAAECVALAGVFIDHDDS